MRISFDMDGVLADMDGALARIAAQEFRKSAGASSAPVPEPPASSAAIQPVSAGELPSSVETPLSPRQQARLWSRVRQTRNFWETLKECEPGTVRRIQKLAHARRWDVLFVTQRPESAGRTPQLQTQHWLRRHGFEYPSVYTTQGSRGKIAAGLTLDVHIDDRLDNCVDVASDSKAWTILVWRDGESFGHVGTSVHKLGIAAVRTVNDALDKIEEAERGLGGQHGGESLIGRLKRAFGW